MMQIVPMDMFSALFAHFAPSARTFFAGNLCTSAAFEGGGHLHLLRAGHLRLVRDGEADLEVDVPTVLFFPRGQSHRFVIDSAGGADLACAQVDLGADAGNPISRGLPALIVLPLADHSTLAPACDLLWAEAFGAAEAGRQAALDRLFDYFLILLIRHVVRAGLVRSGVLAGLADRRLSRALTAIHEEPQRSWSLADLADVAGMSRARFAQHFRAVVGETAIAYLAGWRIRQACRLLGRGLPVSSAARQAGYDSPAAFARAFKGVLGVTPQQWSRQQSGRPAIA